MKDYREEAQEKLNKELGGQLYPGKMPDKLYIKFLEEQNQAKDKVIDRAYQEIERKDEVIEAVNAYCKNDECKKLCALYLRQ